MVSRADIIRHARTMLGTPFHHQGRIAGRGLDCIGLILVTGRALGLTDFELDVYPRLPQGDRLIRTAREAGFIEIEAALPGDVLCLRFDGDPQHLGFLTDRGILHACQRAGSVIEHRIDANWRRRIVARFRFPGVL